MDIYENPAEHYAAAGAASTSYVAPTRLKTMQPAEAFALTDDRIYPGRNSYGKCFI